MSAPPWIKSGKKGKDSSSDPDTPGGFRFKADPTIPAGQKAIVGPDGKRVGVVKRVGDKWAGSWDNFSQKFASPQAALRQYGMTKKLKKESKDS